MMNVVFFLQPVPDGEAADGTAVSAALPLGVSGEGVVAGAANATKDGAFEAAAEELERALDVVGGVDQGGQMCAWD